MDTHRVGGARVSAHGLASNPFLEVAHAVSGSRGAHGATISPRAAIRVHRENTAVTAEAHHGLLQHEHDLALERSRTEHAQALERMHTEHRLGSERAATDSARESLRAGEEHARGLERLHAEHEVRTDYEARTSARESVRAGEAHQRALEAGRQEHAQGVERIHAESRGRARVLRAEAEGDVARTHATTEGDVARIKEGARQERLTHSHVMKTNAQYASSQVAPSPSPEQAPKAPAARRTVTRNTTTPEEPENGGVRTATVGNPKRASTPQRTSPNGKR